MLLQDFEEKLGEKVENWDAKTLEALTENTEILEIISDLDELKNLYFSVKEKNENFAEEFLAPSYFTISLTEFEGKLGNIIKKFEDEEVTTEELKRELSGLMEGENAYNKLAALLTYINHAETKEETEEKKEEILACFKETFFKLKNQSLDQYYILVAEWLEVIYPLEQIYFENTEEKIFEEYAEELEAFQEEVNAFLMKISAEIAESFKNQNQGE